MNKFKILHITPHLGGGVGRVLLNYVKKTLEENENHHSIICLDYANDYSINFCKDNVIPLYQNMYQNKEDIMIMIDKADIILIHWWNHPLLYDFLIRNKLPKSRVIFWSHVSGFNPPYVFTKKALNYPDLFVFTTPISYEVKEIKKLSNDLKNKIRVVWSTSGIEHVRYVKPKKHKGFNVGYIGTVDYCKMHPDFLKICNKIKIPKIKFIVCGGDKENELKEQARIMGIGNKFIFTGKINDINRYLEIFDVFGYPLAPYHYGTCDQVLAESMACGVVPIVLNNKMEKYMVKDKITGIVAKNINDYVISIEELYKNKKLKELLSKNAKRYAKETFSVTSMNDNWNKIFDEIIKIPKTEKKWKINKKISKIEGKDVFLESIGDYGKVYIEYCKAKTNKEKVKILEKIRNINKLPIWQSNTKGTVHHYFLFFKDDKYLSLWSQTAKDDIK